MKTAATPVTNTAVGIAFLLDMCLVLVFSVLGRQAHAEALTLAGTFETAWPFLAGLALGWALLMMWKRPLSIVWSLALVAITVGAGMLLRLLTDQGTATAFILVATGMTLLFLVGWRLVVAGIRMLNREPRND